MAHRTIHRRQWLSATIAAGATTGIATALQSDAAEPTAEQEFYELRIYRVTDGNKAVIVQDYLRKALGPALNRMGIDRIGVFTPLDEKSQGPAVYVLIPYPTLDVIAAVNPALAADASYQEAAEAYFSLPRKDPPFTRIESRLMKAFAGMPVIEMPEQSKSRSARIFELRIYESHNEDKARLKVEMFNEGEIDIMRAVQMAPVFYGETLISNDVPNLTYMLSASDMESHKKHWSAFINHPNWDRMKKMERYKDTVSKITKVMLQPTDYSQI